MSQRVLPAVVTASALVLAVLATPSTSLARGPGGWTNVGGGLNDRVNALTADGAGRLVVAGQFTDAGGNPAADRIATWDGTAWGAYGPSDSIPGAVNDVLVHNGKVYVAGTFTNAAGNAAADNLAVWDGASWQPFCATLNARALSLEVVGTTLFVGGSFTDAGANPANDGLIACSLATGALLPNVVPADGQGGEVRALTVDSLGALYVGGQFINFAGIAEADYVVKYNGTFSALGSGSGPGGGAIDTANVDALLAVGTDVFVGTDDQDVADIPQADFVVRWNGAAWSAVGSNTGGADGYFPASGPTTSISGMAVYDTKLYVTGRWNNADGNPLADNLAVYGAGPGWTTLGSNGAGNGPWIADGLAVLPWQGAIVVGGMFVDGGGDSAADRLAAYPPPDADRPTVTLTGKPKNTVKTAGTKAKVKYKFTGADPGTWPSDPVSFRCKVDKKAYKACTSPFKVKLKLGKHKIRILAVDASGLQSAKPAKDTVTVVKQ